MTQLTSKLFEIKRVAGVISFYVDGVLMYTPPTQYNSAMKLKVKVRELDIINLKLILT